MPVPVAVVILGLGLAGAAYVRSKRLRDADEEEEQQAGVQQPEGVIKPGLGPDPDPLPPGGAGGGHFRVPGRPPRPPGKPTLKGLRLPGPPPRPGEPKILAEPSPFPPMLVGKERLFRVSGTLQQPYLLEIPLGAGDMEIDAIVRVHGILFNDVPPRMTPEYCQTMRQVADCAGAECRNVHAEMAPAGVSDEFKCLFMPRFPAEDSPRDNSHGYQGPAYVSTAIARKGYSAVVPGSGTNVLQIWIATGYYVDHNKEASLRWAELNIRYSVRFGPIGGGI